MPVELQQLHFSMAANAVAMAFADLQHELWPREPSKHSTMLVIGEFVYQHPHELNLYSNKLVFNS